MYFDEEIDRLEVLLEEDALSEEEVEVTCNALSFCAALNQMFIDNGMLEDSEEVDFDQMENLIDALLGELAAACMLLGTFKDVPSLLRGTAKDLRDKNIPEVPQVIIKGYERLASRIERTTNALVEMKEPKETVEK